MKKHIMTISTAAALAFALPGEQLFKNGGFSDDQGNPTDNYWLFSSQAGISVTEGGLVDGQFRLRPTTPGTEYWHAGIRQSNISLEEGKTYRFNFDAVADQERSIHWIFQLNETPWTYFADEVQTIKPWLEPYGYTFTMEHSSHAASDFLFGCGISSTPVNIDNFALTEITEENVAANGDFTQEKNHWFLQVLVNDGANPVTGEALGYIIDGAYHIAIADASTQYNHIALIQRGIRFEQGKEYEISFDAKATQTRTVNVVCSMNRSPWSGYLSETPEVTTEMKTYTYSFSMDEVTDLGADFYIGVGKDAGSVTIDNVVIKEKSEDTSAPSITSHPMSLTTTIGVTTYFMVSAEGAGELSYQWQKDGVDIANATAKMFTLANVTPADSGSYSCVVTSEFGTVTSNAATLTVEDGIPVFTTAPIGATVTSGDTASFTVSATGTGDLSYQWQKDGINIEGATDTVLTLNGVASSDAGLYTCVVSNTYGSRTSTGALLVVEQGLPVITTVPVAATVTSGDTTSFTISASGTGELTYQWQKDGIDIVGATDTILTFEGVVSSDAGLYCCIVTDEVGSVTSTGALLVVGNNAPLLTKITPQTIHSGDSLEITLDMTDASDLDNHELTIIAEESINYVVSEGTIVVPDPGFIGMIIVPVSVTDGIDTTESVELIITVDLPVGLTGNVKAAKSEMTIPLGKGKTISLNASLKVDEVQISDMRGRLIYSQKIENNAIAIADVLSASGIYLINFKTSKGSILKKVLW